MGVVKVTVRTFNGNAMSSGLGAGPGLVLIPDYMAGATFAGSSVLNPKGFQSSFSMALNTQPSCLT